MLQEKITDCPDITQRILYIDEKREARILFLDNMINLDLLQRDFIRPIQAMSFQQLNDEKKIMSLPGALIHTPRDLDTIVTNLFSGEAVFLCDGVSFAVTCNLVEFEHRGIEEPVTEKNIRGAHEGFVETMNTNLSILRRKAKNNRLKFKELTLGTVTNQKVAIAYIDNITNPKLLSTLYNKIKAINFDGIFTNGYIEQAITDFPNSPFPQYQATERPEKVMASLLEGKLAVLVEGTPVVILAPVSFFSFFQALDDYSTQWINSSLLRFLRITSLFTALFLPSLYIAITSYHYYAVPLNLLVTLAESRARVPFPPIIEVLILEIMVEMVREASIRLPTYIGTSISVVAGLIIGQAAVEAGVVSNLLIVIVASTAIASYVIPSYEMGLAIRVLRFVFLIAASLFGIIGIIVCVSFFLAHVVTIESLGQPYYQPVIPFKAADLRDTLFRLPFKYIRNRPSIAKPMDKKRGKRND
jgi:spore germination protein